jgi:hypothetical protein
MVQGSNTQVIFAMKKLGLAAFALALAVSATAQIYDTKQGKLEFVGLKRWSPERIMKELGYKSFDEMHACAGVLKQKLGFAEAAVIGTFTEDKKIHFLVSVVEPEDKDRVSRTQPYESVVTPDDWYPVTKAVTANMEALMEGMNLIATGKENELPAVFTDIRKLNRPSDLETAIKVATLDRDTTDRVIAVAVLMNFPQEDRAWHALAATVRDGQDLVSGVAYSALGTMAKKSPRKVDWKPAAKDLRYILNGTSLFGAPAVMKTLIATQISPDLAKDLVGSGGGQILVPFLSVHRPLERDLAHDLLKKLSGQDHGLEANRWQGWLDSLK